MNQKSSVVVALALGSVLAACSSSNAGPGTASQYGEFTQGWACACPNGTTACKLKCPDATTGSCQKSQPYCDVQVVDGGLACTCPNGQTDCSITCPNGSSGKCSNGQPTCGAQIDGGGQLQWYTTCGYPVCQTPDGGSSTDAGASCPPVGSSCTQQGQTCGTPTQANCGVTLVCASQDPKGGVGGCPISTRKYKNGISYLNSRQLKQLHDEALKIKLATYRYKPVVADPLRTHLGFIIEDDPESPAVDRTHHRVDMYGYVSMVVAAMQVQEKEIADLKKELEASRHEAAACRASSR